MLMEVYKGSIFCLVLLLGAPVLAASSRSLADIVDLGDVAEPAAATTALPASPSLKSVTKNITIGKDLANQIQSKDRTGPASQWFGPFWFPLTWWVPVKVIVTTPGVGVWTAEVQGGLLNGLNPDIIGAAAVPCTGKC
jgi:hypothetical protein